MGCTHAHMMTVSPASTVTGTLTSTLSMHQWVGAAPAAKSSSFPDLEMKTNKKKKQQKKS